MRARFGDQKRQIVFVVVALLLIGCTGLSGDDKAANRGTVTVMAASSLTDAVESVAETFSQASPSSGTRVISVTAGSSALVAQLAAGAEADVLMTADQATINAATSQGLVRAEPVAIASNTLVLATAEDNPASVNGLQDLARGDLLVGLCTVEVPCGSLARRALSAAGIEPAPDTLEQSVRSLTAKLRLGELDVALVYATDARSAGLGTVDAPELRGYVNLYYMASVSAEPSPHAQAFLDAFTAPGGAGTEALQALGFGPP